MKKAISLFGAVFSFVPAFLLYKAQYPGTLWNNEIAVSKLKRFLAPYITLSILFFFSLTPSGWADYEGFWQGTTNSGRPISFAVNGHTIEDFQIKLYTVGGYYSYCLFTETVFTIPFSGNSFTHETVFPGREYSGTFTSLNTCTGTWYYSDGVCGWGSGTWTAQRINSANTPPTISDISDQLITENSSTNIISFTIGDSETPAENLIVTGISSNIVLVPDENIVFGGTGANKTITITPAPAKTGTTTITVTVSDGNDTASDSFLLNVITAPEPIIVIDFGSTHGIWKRYADGRWSKLHSLSSEIITIGDINGSGRDDIIVDFGPSIGVWILIDDASWTRLHLLSPEAMVTGDIDGSGKDDIIVDFGPNAGIWVRYDDVSWKQLHSKSPDAMVTGDINGNGKDDVIIDFGAEIGIWVRYDDVSWKQLHKKSPETMVTGDMNGNNKDEVIIDFGPNAGTWVRYDDVSWKQLHARNPEAMVTGDMNGNSRDDVIIDFGPGVGIWVRYDDVSWTRLHTKSPDAMVTGDIDGSGEDDVIIDFGTGTGIWVRYNDTSWGKLHNMTCEGMAVGEMDGK